MTTTAALLTGRDPSQIIPVAEACGFLGISRPTIYRLGSLRRIRVSPNRVGYRVGDVLAHAHRGYQTAEAQPVRSGG